MDLGISMINLRNKIHILVSNAQWAVTVKLTAK
jgi:hypothetical protein